ncbi:MAG: glycosyltransferase family 1 protein [Anaerolineae bacterium]|nr:glycosyltransferase family 1 protein [Anaerolineae bacterium]
MSDSLSPSDWPARVGLNAQLLSLTETYRGAGINGYIHNLLHRLPAAAPDLHFTAFLNERSFAPPPGLAVRYTRWPTGRPPVRIVWEQLLLPRLLRVLGMDLLHGLAYATPLASPCPTVVTVHDLTFFRFPETLKPFKRCYLRAATRSATRRAVRIIAVSRQTRDDLAQILQVPLEKVDVVHNGVSEAFHPVAAQEVAAFRQRRGLPPRFILFLGTLEPRKNIERLLEAFARWLKGAGREMQEAVKLVVAGAKGWYFEHIFARAAALGLADEVLFPGFLPAAELPWWYRAAECFVYPSLYEGFGLPVLEAMACGTPVITSSASSLPEVAGDAAITVNPYDVAALAEAIAQVMADAARREEMRQAGLQQAARFPWSKAAAETVAVYRRALAVGGTTHG